MILGICATTSCVSHERRS